MCLPPWVARAFAEQDRARAAVRGAEHPAIRDTTIDQIDRKEETVDELFLGELIRRAMSSPEDGSVLADRGVPEHRRPGRG